MTVRVKALGAILASTFVLTACEQTANTEPTASGADGPVDTTVTTPVTSLEPQLEQRPDIFAVRDMAVWDGRPSLGGPWVAHPDVSAAERVEITNLSNNIVTSAALFRRERALPGPPFQLSAEAAIALNVPAGVPVQVSVVAVREGLVEAVVVPAPVAPVAEDVVEPVAEPVEAPSEIDPSTPVEADASAEPAETPAPVVVEAVEPAQEPAAAPNAPDQPFMQVGMFGVAANAEALVTRLTEAGLPASGRPAGSLTRVVVGPAASTQELATYRDRLRALGFSDSIAISLQ
ncbi:SPOR domain-containing protein [Pontivivens insulae]|uniref:Cell division protein DedD n=1 Tax=Pontivivens insulae TaxID=1639689 RepID=A0A2R8AFG8_9RHOB|nr:SPOR domain-containing protein [Pontivivens insulae]RED12170.1 sporulation related protein [Pontivivens insulae]SPF30926.1 Cell division protein DedD [Pontivivens insulae]